MIMDLRKVIGISLVVFGLSTSGFGQTPIRVGTTAANFLEYGYGSVGSSMGDAYVSLTHDMSAVYWNPAGLSKMKKTSALFVYQPWLVDINTSLVAVGLVLPRIGTLGLSILNVDYGEMDVTTLSLPEGTGETFTSNDFAAGLSFARSIVDWFAFGATAKFIHSSIRHTAASAFAMDMGVIINTEFLSPVGGRENGMKIGMSVSNYGTRMQYDGIDMINPIDILPNEEGNFRDVPGQFRMQQWELPLIFRVGVSVNPVVTSRQKLTLAFDALHPNNNSESVNVGGEYSLKVTSSSEVFLRTGYKGLFMDNSEYGMSFGGGLMLKLIGNKSLRIDYAVRDIGVLGNVSSYSIELGF